LGSTGSHELWEKLADATAARFSLLGNGIESGSSLMMWKFEGQMATFAGSGRQVFACALGCAIRSS